MSSLRKATLLAALLAAACGGGSSGTSRVSVLLKDAPGPFTRAVVTIDEVRLVGAGGAVVLSSTPTTVNLLDLANDVAPLVSERPVDRGTYSELRLVVSGGWVQLQDGTVFASKDYPLPAGVVAAGTLKMPSFAQSGLKIDMPGDALVIDGDTKILLVDFDVAQSFGHEAGGSGSWVMHPVVKGVDLVLSGNLVVTVSLPAGAPAQLAAPLAGYQAVVATDPGAPASQVSVSPRAIQLAPDAADPTRFVATFKYLFPGSYAVSFAGVAPVAPALETLPAAPATVRVSAQANARADFVLASPPGAR